MRIGLFAFALLALPLQAAAQSGELWEITTQMPGMPAGMMKPQRVCQGDDPERARAAQKDNENCKVTDKKQTTSRTQITMACKSGTMTIDQKYNAARTEFTSTMSMKGKDGDFTMNMTGKKVGACDVVAARKEQDAKVDAAKKQVAAGQAQGAAALKQMSENQIKTCSDSLDKMHYAHLSTYHRCNTSKDDKQCQQLSQAYPEATKACMARSAEFCKRFQTPEGFLKTSSREEAGKMCGVSTASVISAQCPRVAKTQSPLAFLGAFCPAEAKPIAMEHCTGRDYTSKNGGKYASFCERYLANADFQGQAAARQRAEGAAPASSGTVAAPSGTQSQQQTQGQQTQGQQTADQVKQGVSKGIDKLRGLFSR